MIEIQGSSNVDAVLEELAGEEERLSAAFGLAVRDAGRSMLDRLRKGAKSAFARGRTGHLSASFQMRERGGVTEIVSDSPYLNILDRGGLVAAKRSTLAIPFRSAGVVPGQTPKSLGVAGFRVATADGHKFLARAGTMHRSPMRPLFLLRRTVKLRGRNFLAPLLEKAIGEATTTVDAAIGGAP